VICTGAAGAAAQQDYHYAFSMMNGSVWDGTTPNAFKAVEGLGFFPRRVDIADFDADGDYDFFLEDYAVGEYKYYQNLNDNGTNWSIASAVSINYDPTDWSGMCHGDFDEDGDLDLIVLDGNNPELLVNTGNGAFDDTGNLPVNEAGASNPRQVACGDFNGDEDFDFVALTVNSEMKIYYGNGDGSFEDGVQLNSYIDDCHALFVIDVDDDGDLDLISQVDSANADEVQLYKNTKGVFARTDLTDLGTNLIRDQWGDGSVWDLNNDGYLDIMRGDYTNGATYFWVHWGSAGNTSPNYGFSAPNRMSTAMDNYHMDCSGPEYSNDLDIAFNSVDEYDIVFGTSNLDVSKITDVGKTSMKPYLNMSIDHWNGTGWYSIFNPVNSSQRTLASGGFINLRSIWKGIGSFNTSNITNGTYRFNVELRNPTYSYLLENQNGTTMNYSYGFMILYDAEPPKYYDVYQYPTPKVYRGEYAKQR